MVEGIRDGAAVDQCFYCALLFPATKDCPRCQGRVRYRPASLARDEDLRALCQAALSEFANSPTRERAERLGELAFEMGEEVHDLLGSQWLGQVRAILCSESGGEP